MPSILPDRIIQRIFPSRPPISIDDPSGSRATHRPDTFNVLQLLRVRFRDKRAYVPCLKRRSTVWADRRTIDILPDDVLLHLFHFDRLAYLENADQGRRPSWTWNRLVHVCRRWRFVVFASPNFLDLKLVWGPRTRVELTDIWPPLPIIIGGNVNSFIPHDYDFGASLVHLNRVCEICLRLKYSQLQQLISAMRVQLPALTRLTLLAFPGYQTPFPCPALPDEFLGGFAPRLQSLMLESIPLPVLPKFLSSTTDLIDLHLMDIPYAPYMSPEAIVASLSTLTSLKRLSVGFRSTLSHPTQESRHPPPLTRTILPALTRFEFKGVGEYLEDLLARIDVPLLDYISVAFARFIPNIPQLAQLMRRTTKFNTRTEAHAVFDSNYGFRVDTHVLTRTLDEKSGLKILYRGLYWRLSYLVQFSTFFPSIFLVEHLYIYEAQYLPSQRDMNVAEWMAWLSFFRQFTGVKYLYISNVFTPQIAFALQKLVFGRMTEVLPTLQNIFLQRQPSEPIPEGIGKFVAARQLSGRPISVSLWEGRDDSE